MPWNLLLLPLLGGYVFCRECYYTRFKFKRFESYRLIFESALWGLLFLVVARFLVYWFRLLPAPFLQSWASFVGSLAPFPYLSTAFGAFLLGPVTAFVANRFCDEVSAKDLAVENSGDELLGLLIDAMDRDFAVLLTLSSRKVYVGYVWQSPSLDIPEMSFVVLLPVISGFRDSATLTVTFTTNYISLWQTGKVSPEDFLIVIPTGTITSASLFDRDVYESHFLPTLFSKSSK